MIKGLHLTWLEVMCRVVSLLKDHMQSDLVSVVYTSTSGIQMFLLSCRTSATALCRVT